MKRNLMLLLALLLVSALPAQAKDSVVVPIQAVLRPGSLTVSSNQVPIQFPVVSDSGPVEAASVPTFTVIDARGSGDGWHLTLTSDDLRSAEGNVIPATALSYQAVGGVVGHSTNETIPTPPQETGGLGRLSGMTVLSAAVNAGMGTWSYTPNRQTLQLQVPPGTPSGMYSGILTATIASGP